VEHRRLYSCGCSTRHSTDVSIARHAAESSEARPMRTAWPSASPNASTQRRPLIRARIAVQMTAMHSVAPLSPARRRDHACGGARHFSSNCKARPSAAHTRVSRGPRRQRCHTRATQCMKPQDRLTRSAVEARQGE
jgi:hypothetical protein